MPNALCVEQREQLGGDCMAVLMLELEDAGGRHEDRMLAQFKRSLWTLAKQYKYFGLLHPGCG